MNNNPNVNNSFINNVPNNNPVPNNNLGSVDVTQNQPNTQNSVPASAPQNNVVTLGTVSNVTYADTIGNIDYGTPPVDPNTVESQPSNPENFINNDYNETSISDLNVEGTYNNMNVPPDYTTDSKVMANLHPEKKNTITIDKELKTFFLIAIVLLLFIFVLPNLLDVINKIRFH